MHVVASSTRWHANATFSRARRRQRNATKHKGNEIEWKVKPVLAAIRTEPGRWWWKKRRTERRQKKNSTFLRFYELYSSFTHHKCRINYVHFQGHRNSSSSGGGAQPESTRMKSSIYMCVCVLSSTEIANRGNNPCAAPCTHSHTDRPNV